MGSAVNRNSQAPSSSSKPPLKRSGAASTADGRLPTSQNPRPYDGSPQGNGSHYDPSIAASSSALPLLLDGTDEDAVLRSAGVLTREEVLRRRSRRLKQLSRYYRDQYWVLMETTRSWHREYCWRYGKSPVERGDGGGMDRRVSDGGDVVNGASLPEIVMAEGSGESGRLWFGGVDNRVRGKHAPVVMLDMCKFPGCKTKAMALTSYCHQHILSDPRQTLYKACSYVIKSAPTGQIVCGKPVLRSAVPSLCPLHFQKAQRHVSQALKRAGLNMSSSSRNAPKFHVIVAEYVNQIQAKRKDSRKLVTANGADKDKIVG